VWGPCPHHQNNFFCHISLTGGPILSVFVSIRNQCCE
jgi:hypothetical protein